MTHPSAMPPTASSRPLPLRSLSKNDAKRLPQSRKVQFLYAASVAMASRNPKYASYLGRRCVHEMTRCVQPHGVSRSDIAKLCKRCGCPFEEENGRVVPLSRSTVRRSQRAAAKAKKNRNPAGARGVSVVRAGIEYVCQACGNTCPAYKYATEDIAAEVLAKKRRAGGQVAS